MTVILDTNVVLDVLLKRTPHFEKSALVLLLSEKKLIDGFVSASAITDIFFLTNATYHDKKMSMDLLKNLLKTVSIALKKYRQIILLPEIQKGILTVLSQRLHRQIFCLLLNL
jgi:predicted nucleic acid-binding protein